MKKLYVILTLVVMTCVYTPGTFAGYHRYNRINKSCDSPKNTTGVPLDGGLLALLAGAGITYFTARKKKKNEE